MNWLQKRLNELEYTHTDLQQALKDVEIVRVRATITGWTNEKPVSLLNNPDHTQKLAKVLDWTVLELLVAAGYDLEVPLELAPIIKSYRNASDKRKQELIVGLHFIVNFNEPEETKNDVSDTI